MSFNTNAWLIFQMAASYAEVAAAMINIVVIFSELRKQA
jgi:hypothetical protein